MVTPVVAHAEEPAIARELDKFGKSLCKAFALKCKSTETAVPLPRPKPVLAAKPKREIAAKKPKPAKPIVAAKREKKPVIKPVSSVSVEWPEPARAAEPEKTDFPVASITKPPVAEMAPKGNMGDGCLEALKAAGADFSIPAIPASAGTCDVEVPVRVSSIGRVVLTDKPMLSCRAASRLAAWISEVAEPVILSKTGSALAYVKTGPGHDCSSKNGEALALRNEHASGDAIDVAAFATADGRMIAADGAALPEASLLKGLSTSACGYFTTVLAPSASPGNHYHFDLGRHGKGGSARVCE